MVDELYLSEFWYFHLLFKEWNDQRKSQERKKNTPGWREKAATWNKMQRKRGTG